MGRTSSYCLWKSHAIFSDCRKYRYVLWRTWDSSKEYVLFIGLNPSTADELTDDHTITRCISFAKDWNFGALCMVNLFAFRATKPKDMKKASDPVGQDNDYWITNTALRSGQVVAAWGADGSFKGRDKRVRELLGGMYCLGLTKDGHPKHPLYQKKDTTLRLL